MSDRIFQTAYDRVRARHSDEEWLALSPRQITDAIYKEIRAIDAERAAPRRDGAMRDAAD
jgi:hypothetical protein